MKLSNHAGSQRQRIIDYLKQHGRITTLEARTNLDVFHPAARIQELKGRGDNIIITYRRMVNSGLGEHKIAEYVLMP